MLRQYVTAHVIEEGAGYGPSRTLKADHIVAHSHDIYALAVTPNYVVSGSGGSSIKIWDLASPERQLVHEFSGAHRLGVHHITASEDGKKLASAGFGGEIILWDLQSLSQLDIVGSCDKEHKVRDAWALCLSRDGDKLVSTTSDGNIDIWDTKSQPSQKLQQYATKGSFSMCIDVNPEGNLIASGHENGGMYVFNAGTGRMTHSFHGLVKPVRTIKFSPAGKLLAAAGDSNAIALFDVLSGEQIASLSGHVGWIFSLSWSATGEYILSGSFDGRAKVWSTDTRECVATQNESEAPVHAAQWVPKNTGIGEGFVTAGASKRIYFYRESTGSDS